MNTAKAMERMNRLSKVAMSILDEVGVEYTTPVKWALSKATTTWGTCQMKKNPITGEYDYSIRISLMTLDESRSDDKVLDTIIHELIHTVKGCMNHQSGFKNAAWKVMNAHPEFNISRCQSFEDSGLSREAIQSYKKTPKITYRVKCVMCGRTFEYHKQNGLVYQTLAARGVATNTAYTCPCGSNFFKALAV